MGAGSLFNGPRPDIKTYASTKEEGEAVTNWLRKLNAEGTQFHQLTLFLRSAGQLGRAKVWLPIRRRRQPLT